MTIPRRWQPFVDGVKQYLHLFAGGNQGVEDDGLPPNFSTTPTATYPFTTPNLGAELIAARFSFAGFSESLESAAATDWADYDPQGTDTVRAHWMPIDWSDTATWNSLAGGVSSDDVESAAGANFSFIPEVAGAPTITPVLEVNLGRFEPMSERAKAINQALGRLAMALARNIP